VPEFAQLQPLFSPLLCLRAALHCPPARGLPPELWHRGHSAHAPTKQ
jgi:hypothetical protein